MREQIAEDGVGVKFQSLAVRLLALLAFALAGCATTKSTACTVTIPAQREWHTWRIRHKYGECAVVWVPPECGAECEETKEP